MTHRTHSRIFQNKTFLLLLPIAALLFFGGQVRADNQTWIGATSGSWGTTTNWNTTTPSTNGTANFTSASGASQVISLGSGVTINTIVFDTAAAFTTGSSGVGAQTLTLSNAGASTTASITMNSDVANNELFNANIILGTDATTQSYAFTNNSTNTLNFAGSITGNASSGSSGTKTLTDAGSGNVTISGAISNGGATVAISQIGGGTLTLSGANTYNGAVAVTAGTLAAGASTLTESTAGAFGQEAAVTLSSIGTLSLNNFSATLGSLAGTASTTVALGSSGVLTLLNATAQTFAGAITGGGSSAVDITADAAKVLTLTGGSSFTGALVVNGYEQSATIGNVGLTINGLSGQLSGVTGVTVSGEGTFIDGDSSTTSNNNSFSTGRINTGAVLTLGDSTYGGGTFEMEPPSTSTLTQSFAGLNLYAGESTLADYNSAHASGLFALTGALNRQAGGVLNVYQVPVSLNSTAVANSSSAISNGVLIGWVPNGAGFESVSNSGGTVGAAALYVNNSPSTWAGTSLSASNVEITSAPSTTLSGNATINALELNSGGSTLTITSGTLTIGSGEISEAAGSGGTITSGTITSGNGTDLILIAATGGISVNSVITGNIGVTMADAGTAETGTLGGGSSDTAANTYTGVTYVDAGTLELNKAAGTNAIGGDLVINGGTLIFGAANQWGNNGVAAPNVTISQGSINFANNLSPTMSTLTIEEAAPFTTTGVNITLNSSATAALTLGGAAGTYFSAADPTITFTSNSGGGIVINDLVATTITANLALGTGSTVFQRVINVYNNIVDNVANGTGGTPDVTLTGVISGGNGIEKAGPGELVLNGNNTFTGGVTIDAGVLEVGNNGALNSTNPNSVVFSAGSTGTLRLYNHNVTISSLSSNGGTPVVENDNSSGAVTLTINQSSSTVYGGVIQDGSSTDSPGGAIKSLALTKSGAGSLTLSGVNTYSSYTTVTAGTLELANETALYSGTTADWGSSGGKMVINSGATLAFQVGTSPNFTVSDISTFLWGSSSSGFEKGSILGLDTTPGNFTYTSAIANPYSGSNLGVTKLGANTLTLSTASSYTGATTVAAGTLIVSGGLSGTVTPSVLSGATLEVDNATINTAATVSVTGGTLQGTGGTVGTVTVNSSGNLAPGNSAGSGAAGVLHAGNVSFLDTNSKFSIRLGVASSTDNDQLISTGTVLLDNTPINVTAGGALNNLANVGLAYVIINGGAGATGTGTDLFTYNGSAITNGNTFTNAQGYTFAVYYGGIEGSTLVGTNNVGGANDDELVLESIPEPGTAGAMLSGFGLLIVIQQARRRSRRSS